MYTMFYPWLGTGLLTSDGKEFNKILSSYKVPNKNTIYSYIYFLYKTLYTASQIFCVKLLLTIKYKNIILNKN